MTRENLRAIFLLVAGQWLASVTSPVLPAAEPEAAIHVHADQIIGRISPYTVGACIEDVNHEIYGGLYSQMVFGESFQEPPITVPPSGFVAYGGAWQVKQGELWAAAGEGPKLLVDGLAITTGEVSVELFFPDKKPGNAGMVIKVDQPGVGADKFTGYEIALCPENGTLILGRHRQNWEPIKTVPCDVPVDQWITLTVRMSERSIEALVEGRSLLKFDDAEHPLAAGKIGLRTWQREARYRNLRIKTGDETKAIPFPDQRSGADAVSGMWRAVRQGTAQGSLTIETHRPFIGTQSQRITFDSGEGTLGVENKGLNHWGMNFVAGKPYEGYLWVRSDKAAALIVALENSDGGKTFAESRLDIKPGDWQRLDFTLTPSEADTAGRLTIRLDRPGSVVVGHAFLQPGEWGRFEGLPVRKDVAEALVAQGLTVLRYGGSMINHPEYRWKKMIGPRDRRPPHHGTWYAHSTNGWGIIDFLSFCEAAGFLAIPALNMDETPQDMADFVEYVNGSPESAWGGKRVADGHAAPFKLKYIELGNEEAINDAYWRKFKPLAEAIWSKDATITPVVGDFAYGQHIADPYDFPGAPNIKSLATHKQILDFAASQKKPVWFDVHIGNDAPRDCDRQLVVLGELIAWLEKLSPQADFKVCIFEENAGNPLWRRGLAHARTINGLERFGDRVPIVCAANCLQPDGQNDNGWDQGLLFLSPSKVWGQPSYYVTQMISRNNLPKLLKAEVQSPAGALNVTARLSDDGKTLVLQVANAENRPISTRLNVDGFDVSGKKIKLTQMAGPLEAKNTAADPKHIVPSEQLLSGPASGESLDYVFPPQSFTVMRIE